MKIADETIIKFRNGEKLYMPSEMYEELEFKRDGSVECSWTEDGHDCNEYSVWFSMYEIFEKRSKKKMGI